MSFFQGLGNFAGGVAQGASPYIQMMMRDKMEQDKEDRDASKLQGAMSVMNNQVPAYTPQEIGEMQSAGYTPQERPAGAEPMRQSSGGSIMEKKASFIDTIANMRPNEALGAYTAELTKHGVKIDKTSLGVFDMLSKGVAQGKAEMQAEEARTQAESSRKASGLFIDQFMKANPKYAPVIDGMLQQGVQAEDMASLLPTISSLVKQDESISSREEMFREGQKNKLEMFGQGLETKQMMQQNAMQNAQTIAAMRGSNTEFQNANLEFKKQQAEDRRQERLDAQKAKDDKYLMDRKSDRTVNANKVLKDVPNFDKMKSTVEKKKAIDGYIKSGIVPTIKTDANGVHYASFGTKSNPTKKATQSGKVKEKKHDPYGLL